jgi:hypothetical protein
LPTGEVNEPKTTNKKRLGAGKKRKAAGSKSLERKGKKEDEKPVQDARRISLMKMIEPTP